MNFFPCYYADGTLFAAYAVSDIRKVVPYNATTSVIYVGKPGQSEDVMRKVEVFTPVAELIDLLNSSQPA